MMYLAVDNTRPVDFARAGSVECCIVSIDPTLPDLYDGIHDDCELPPGAAIAMAVGGLMGRLGGIAFWVAVGLAVGLVV